MFLTTDVYSPAGTGFHITTKDLDVHKAWMPTVTSRMPSGSNYFLELCHNGNGNIQV
jgi:hypothetical protein